MIDEQLQKMIDEADRVGYGEINEEVWICMFLDVFRVVMRGSIFPTGLIVMPVFACADKGDYLVSAGCTLTVKFNATDEILVYKIIESSSMNLRRVAKELGEGMIDE